VVACRTSRHCRRDLREDRNRCCSTASWLAGSGIWPGTERSVTQNSCGADRARMPRPEPGPPTQGLNAECTNSDQRDAPHRYRWAHRPGHFCRLRRWYDDSPCLLRDSGGRGPMRVALVARFSPTPVSGGRVQVSPRVWVAIATTVCSPGPSFRHPARGAVRENGFGPRLPSSPPPTVPSESSQVFAGEA